MYYASFAGKWPYLLFCFVFLTIFANLNVSKFFFKDLAKSNVDESWTQNDSFLDALSTSLPHNFVEFLA